MEKQFMNLVHNSRLTTAIIVFASFWGIAFWVMNSMESISASTWNDAKSYYDEYGNNAVFRSTSDKDGLIYCVTKGNTSASLTKYVTLGWRIQFTDSKGKVIQNIYLKLGGDYLKAVDSKRYKDYTYYLYSTKLSSVKKLLKDDAKKALKTGKCTLVLDACMTVAKSGKNTGSMEDGGSFSGKVYTSYKGISEAEKWSSSALAALHTYFGKSVVGLFHTITLSGDLGIETVEGAGKYCHGTKVTVEAKPAYGYVFKGWKGKGAPREESFSFYLSENLSYVAYSEQKYVLTTYHRNAFSEDGKVEQRQYYFEDDTQCFWQSFWNKAGYHMTGWSSLIDQTGVEYEENEQISQEWVVENYSKADLYSVWEVNEYTIIFDGKLVEDIAAIDVNFEDEIVLPANGKFLGWSISPGEEGDVMKAADKVFVCDLVEACGLGQSPGAELVLYAVWDSIPLIDARDIFFSLDQAKDGEITEDELSSYMTAYDVTDGNIDYGYSEDNYFIIKNLNEEEISAITEETVFRLDIEAKNSLGKRTNTSIDVYIIDTEIKADGQTRGRVRFISDRYYSAKHGGLRENSIWKKNEEYRSLLEKCIKRLP